MEDSFSDCECVCMLPPKKKGERISNPKNLELMSKEIKQEPIDHDEEIGGFLPSNITFT